MDLKFEILLARALKDWPSEVDLSILEKSGSDETRYTIKGLSDMENTIDERYYGAGDEILLRNLHSAIYTVLHKVAAHVTHVRLADLRLEAVRVSFEKFLRGCMEGPDPTFPPADIQVGEQYFAANPPL